MKKFVIERILPGAGNLSPGELKEISQKSCAVAKQIDTPYHWIESYVLDDKIYCIHIAEGEEVVRRHSKLANFPINTVEEVRTIIDPSTGNQ